jgi:lipopolysaccharide biosynthesis glycosyltransferase
VIASNTTSQKRIDKIVIACFKKDLHLLRICVSSIRYWYPDIEIYLLRDVSSGKFSTKEIEKYFSAQRAETMQKYTGWGLAKLEALFTSLDRYLLLDSDTLFSGSVLDLLSSFPEEFIVTGEKCDNPDDPLIRRDFLRTKELKVLNGEFEYPGYGINTGQMVVKNKVIRESEIDDLLIMQNGTLTVKYPDIFMYADQGILNYVLACKKNTISIGYYDFWLWAGGEKAQRIDLHEIKRRNSEAWILHWSGIKPLDFAKTVRYDLLMFYEELYYNKIPFGKIKRRWRKFRLRLITYFKSKDWLT